jgi:hypothetical protein
MEGTAKALVEANFSDKDIDRLFKTNAAQLLGFS